MRRKSILPGALDKRSKELDEACHRWLLSGRDPTPDQAVHAMHELLAGARSSRAVVLLTAYSSPLPLLAAVREAGVPEGQWDLWAGQHVRTPAQAEEFLRYCADEPLLVDTPAFPAAVTLFVHDT